MSDPLDKNLERLLRVAPARERLDRTASVRIADALRDAAAPQEPVDAPVHPSRPTRARFALLAAAAAFLAIVAGALLQRTAPETPEDPAPSGRVADARPVDATAPTGASDTTLPDPGDRVAVTPTAPGTTEIGPGTAGAGSAAALTLRGTITLGDSMAAAPAEVDIWVRPLVDLPRVADAVLHRVPWPGGTDALDFELEEALGTVPAFGTDRFLVHVAAAGAGSSITTSSLRSDGPAEVGLTLRAQWFASGFVTDVETGAPIEGALVVAVDQVPVDALGVHPEDEGDPPTPSAVTDAAGRYRLAGLRRDSEARLRASAPGYAPSWVTARASEPASETDLSADLSLGLGGRVEGLVERQDGTRWAGALLIASRQDFHPTGPFRPLLTYGVGRADEEGAFVIDDLPAGTYVVLHFGDVEVPTPEPVSLQMTGVEVGKATRVDFRGEGSPVGGVLRGRVKGIDGELLVGRTLTLSKADARSEAESEWQSVQTGGDGSFSFAGVSPGAYTLLLADEGFARFAVLWSGEVEGLQEIDVTLPAGSATFKASLEEGSAPGDVAGAWALLERFDEGRGSWEFAGFGRALGGLDLPVRHLLDGRYRGTMAPFSDSLAVASVPEFEIVDGGHVDVVVPVKPGSSLEVEVVDAATGEPRPGLTFTVLDASGEEVPQQTTPVTDDAGHAVSRGVPLGAVTLRLEDPGGMRTERRLALERGGPGAAAPLRWELK